MCSESERYLRECFNRARANRPCILLFDEVDAMSVKRESNSSGILGIIKSYNIYYLYDNLFLSINSMTTHFLMSNLILSIYFIF